MCKQSLAITEGKVRRGGICSPPTTVKPDIIPSAQKVVNKIEESTPNCAICKWRVISSILNDYVCSAQANRLLPVSYNNKECKKLFKEKDVSAFYKKFIP